MLSHSKKVLFVRFLFFGIVAFELPKMPFMVASCSVNSCEYYAMPQFLDSPAPLKSSAVWILTHQILCMLIVETIGLRILGYEIEPRTHLILHVLMCLGVMFNPFHIGTANEYVAALLNISTIIRLSYQLYKKNYFEYLVTLSVPIWLFDSIGAIYYARNLLMGKFDSRITLFFIQFITSDVHYTYAAKMTILLMSIGGMIGAAHVFVTIPEKTNVQLKFENGNTVSVGRKED